MKPRVLLVEDDPVTRAYFLEVLAGLEAHVDVASTCDGALAGAAAHGYALCLLDAHLPDGDAVALLPRLRERAPGAAVVAHTASRDAALHAALRDAGCSAVLVKPVAPGALLAVCTRHLLPGRTAVGWDDAAAATALGGDPANVRELRALYAAELPAAVSGVRAAVAAGDTAAVRAVLHRLAASTALAGARGMAEAVRRLQAAPLDAEALAGFLRAAAEPAPL